MPALIIQDFAPRGQVEMVHYAPDQLTGAYRDNAIMVDSIPEPPVLSGKDVRLWADTTVSPVHMWYELVDRPRTIEEQLAALLNPKNPDDLYREVDKSTSQLADLSAAKIAQINYLCNQTILGGFTSTALGSDHQYGFNMEDQANLIGQLAMLNADAVIAEVDWKTLDSGVLTHSREQFVQVCKDGESFKKAKIARYWELKSQVEAAVTVEEVDAVTW